MAPEIDEAIWPGKGLVGAVRSETSVTSASMFFFLLDAVPSYKGKHTFFAYVRKGGSVLDGLGELEMSGGSESGMFRPVKRIRILKIEIRGM
jgi:cyclophilin family peptidyl-prolyl cis-trans isomerase